MIPVYGCRFYEKDELIKDYKPCINADGVEGMFDIINNEFLDRDSFLQMVLNFYSTAESVTISHNAKRYGE